MSLFLVSIDNGESYEDHRIDPAVVCQDRATAEAAVTAFNAWAWQLREVVATARRPDDDGLVRLTVFDASNAWLEQNPPPFWPGGGRCLPSYFDNGWSARFDEIPLYEPKEPA